ncbi:MAG TPA: ABC transporter substrate-binding protein, partial [Burkholderiales bacterium]|nr:ABC transporter substrate-binding protein [Burkholderiales bacterium]
MKGANLKYGLLIATLIALFVGAPPVRAAEPGPDALAKSVTDEVLAIVRADREIQSGNRKKVLELVESKIVPHFNFTRMTQLAMGRNWRQASAEQQKLLVDEFRMLLVRTYTAAFTQYRNETVE